MKMFDLTGKVAVVTGASSGLGVQFAQALADAGADVAILARRVDKLEAVSEKIKTKGKVCRVYKCDVSVESDIVDVFAAITKDFGKIDILVNNAGVIIPGPTETCTAESWDKVFDVNCRGVFLAAREALKVMAKNGYGKIINIVSIAGLLGFPALGASYPSSKSAVINLTRTLSAEYALKGITINAIAPGTFASEMTEGFFGGELTDAAAGRTPMGRIGKEGELNGALIYFASDASSYTTGQTIAVDGGWVSAI